MDRNTSKTKTTIIKKPKNNKLLGEITIDPNELRPLGGLNPYNLYFDKIGNSFIKLLIEHADLNKKRKILDLGCGTGRLSKRFCEFLEDGSYEGLDNNKCFIDYCKKSYHKICNFTFCDIQHEEYNPNGKINPINFSFPYDDRSFDLVCAIALFNHFETPWVFKYLSEASRVLNSGGIFFGTFLILNQNSMEHIKNKNKHPFKFDIQTPNSWHEYANRMLLNVAIPESGLRRQFIKCRLMIKEPIRYGEWCGSQLAITGHDVIIATKV